MGLLVDAMYRGFQKMNDMGKSWIIMLPSTPGAKAEILRKKLKKGQFDLKIPGGDGKERIISSPLGAYPTTRGPLHVVGESTGWNLVAPSKEDKPSGVTQEEYQRMRVCDPLIYWRATQENDMEDFYAAQQGKDPWQVRIAPLLLIAVLGLVGLVGIVKIVWFS